MVHAESPAPTGTRGGLTPVWLLLLGPSLLALLALQHLVTTVWVTEEQSYGPVILVVAGWLIWRRWPAVSATTGRPAPLAAWAGWVLASTAVVIGRSQQIIQLEVLAPLLAGTAVLLLRGGWRSLRPIALPLVCLLLVVPMPGLLVQTLTLPMKIGVSQVAESLLHGAGYPVARSGVILAVDQYQMLVADACAGLTSMFTLEAMGLVYINQRQHAVPLRNGLLAVLIVPIAFLANVVRVVVLVLVTYYFGDAAGQGFVHSAAGVLLFVVAMLLMLATDAVLGRLLARRLPALARRAGSGETAGGLAAGMPNPVAPAWVRPGLGWRTAASATLLLVVALPLSAGLRPSHRTADSKPAIDLARQVPTAFAGWREDPGLVPVLPDPRTQAMIESLYTQVLARTYVNRLGQQVMLSIAYGNDQSAEAAAVHRPEFCYRSLGFEVQVLDRATLALSDHRLTVQRLVGRLDRRQEPISYWVTLDETATLPGLDRKLQQLRHGLRGDIADGMVVRVSSLGASDAPAFALQDQFIADLRQALPPAVRGRYYGSEAAP